METIPPRVRFFRKVEVRRPLAARIQALPHEQLPPQQGEILIEQTPFAITLTSSKLMTKSTERAEKNLGGWTWLSANLSDNGRRIDALYEMEKPLIPK